MHSDETSGHCVGHLLRQWLHMWANFTTKDHLHLPTLNYQSEVPTQTMPICVPKNYIVLSARDLQCTPTRHLDTVLAINWDSQLPKWGLYTNYAYLCFWKLHCIVWGLYTKDCTLKMSIPVHCTVHERPLIYFDDVFLWPTFSCFWEKVTLFRRVICATFLSL